jgi:hypothetical protein
MQGGDCFVPRAIGYDTINGWLAIQKKDTNRQSLLDLESQRAPVRSVDDARLDNYTLGSPAHQLRLAKKIGYSERGQVYLIVHLPASAVP